MVFARTRGRADRPRQVEAATLAVAVEQMEERCTGMKLCGVKRAGRWNQADHVQRAAFESIGKLSEDLRSLA